MGGSWWGVEVVLYSYPPPPPQPSVLFLQLYHEVLDRQDGIQSLKAVIVASVVLPLFSMGTVIPAPPCQDLLSVIRWGALFYLQM